MRQLVKAAMRAAGPAAPGRLSLGQAVQRKRGAMSLLLVLFTLGLAVLGTTYFRLADLRRSDYLLGVMAAEQTDAVLSCYERPIFERYGILAFHRDTPDRLGLVAEPGRIEGRVMLEQTPGESLRDGSSLRGQIIDFMQMRLPAKAWERLQDQRKHQDRAVKGVALTEADRQQLIAGQADLAAADFEEAEWGAEYSDDSASLLQDLTQAGEECLAYDLDRGLIKGSLTDSRFISDALAAADRLTHGLERPALSDLMLSEYALGMYDSFVHRQAKQAFPYDRSLRGQSLSGPQASGRADLEYLLFGQADEKGNIRAAQGLIYVQRLALRAGDYVRSPRQMRRARVWGTVISGVLVAVSGGTVWVSPETVARLIWLIESSLAAAEDCRALCRGEGVTLTPYTETSQMKLYYQDQLRLAFLSVSQEDLLSRMATVMEQAAGGPLYTGITVRLDWTSAGQTALSRQVSFSGAYPFGQKEIAKNEAGGKKEKIG